MPYSAEQALTRVEFVIKMASELQKYQWSKALLMAADALTDYLREEDIDYGDPDYAWTESEARSLVWELFGE